MEWFTYNRKKVKDLKEEILTRIDGCTTLLIGTDAIRSGRTFYFVTALVFRKEGKGGSILFTREKITKQHSLWEKLSIETWKSLEAAMMVSTITTVPIEVHVDASPDEKNKSADYVQQLVGMVVGQGFKCQIKPDSWVSTHVSDHIVRQKHLPAREKALWKKHKRKRKK